MNLLMKHESGFLWLLSGVYIRAPHAHSIRFAPDIDEHFRVHLVKRFVDVAAAADALNFIKTSAKVLLPSSPLPTH